MSRFTAAPTGRVAPDGTRTTGDETQHDSCPPRIVGTSL